MGWYPWNEFGQDPQNEKLIKEITDALISSGMKEAGYVYVGPDEGKCFSRARTASSSRTWRVIPATCAALATISISGG